MAKKKSSQKRSGKYWIIGIIIVIAVVAALVIAQNQGPAIDYSQYAYMDSDVDNPSAAHTITEFSDFQCPYCAATAPVLRAVEQDFDVHVEFKHFPLSGHPFAQSAAEAAECARDQGRFWAMHDLLFQHNDALAKADFLAHAEGLGMDVDSFNSCITNREKQLVVEGNKAEGVQKGVRGTPTIFLDDELVNYRTYDAWAAALS